MWRSIEPDEEQWANPEPQFVYCNACDQVFQYSRSGPRDQTEMDIVCPICNRSTALEKTLEVLEKQEKAPAGLTLADWGVTE